MNAAACPTAILMPAALTGLFLKTGEQAPLGHGRRDISQIPRREQRWLVKSCASIATTWHVRTSFKNRLRLSDRGSVVEGISSD